MLNLAVMLGRSQVPPLQSLAYSFRNILPAFRQFARAQHVGKIVTSMPFPAGPGGREQDGKDGCWVVSGGMGALGILMADWLAGQGRSYIALLGRSGRYARGSRQNVSPNPAQGADTQRADKPSMHVRPAGVWSPLCSSPVSSVSLQAK